MIYLEGFYDRFNKDCFLHRITREEFSQLFDGRKCVSVSDTEVEYIRSLINDDYTLYDKVGDDGIRYIDIVSKSGLIQLLIDKYDDEWWAVTRFVQIIGYYYSIDSRYYYSIDSNDGLIELKDTFFGGKGGTTSHLL
jgi:hypothetical protein